MSREYPFGFHMKCIAAGETVSVEASPAQAFIAHRLVIPESIGKDFELVKVVVDGIDQKVPAGPCTNWSEHVTGGKARVELATIKKGMTCALVVRNTSHAPADFTACLIGSVEGSTGQ